MDGPHVVGIVGGAVAGSEAAALCAARGAIAVVFEQNRAPYGKIEDGLPRWHDALRAKEYDRIDANLTQPGVLYLPNTAVGKDVSVDALFGELGLSALILANGAWRDRPLPIEDAEQLVGHGLVYQNALVYAFNHAHEASYSGPPLDVADGAYVIGGGLASIDVAKILNLVSYQRALADRGIEVDLVALEHRGIDKTLVDHGLTQAELGVSGCTLVYRRRAEDMPLATADNPTPERLAKLQKTRVKLLDKVRRRYLVNFRPLSKPVALHADEHGRVSGISLQATRLEGRRVIAIEGAVETLPTSLVVSSIGSIPQPIADLPMKGELYAWRDWDTGRLDDARPIYGLGNVLTGKGNIKASRKNARAIGGQLLTSELSLDAEADDNAAIAAVVEAALAEASSATRVGRAAAWIRARQAAVGFDGDYAAWVKSSRG